MSSSEIFIDSPCVGQCGLNADGVCAGCFRTRDEILGWENATTDQQQQIVSDAEERRKSHEA